MEHVEEVSEIQPEEFHDEDYLSEEGVDLFEQLVNAIDQEEIIEVDMAQIEEIFQVGVSVNILDQHEVNLHD